MTDVVIFAELVCDIFFTVWILMKLSFSATVRTNVTFFTPKLLRF